MRALVFFYPAGGWPGLALNIGAQVAGAAGPAEILITSLRASGST